MSLYWLQNGSLKPNVSVQIGVRKQANLKSATFYANYCTQHSAVLLELGFLRMKHVIAKLQTTYMNQIIIWEMQGTKVNEVIMEELKMHGEKSTLGLVLKLASEYGFDDMTDVMYDRFLKFFPYFTIVGVTRKV